MSRRPLVVATANPGKLRELRALLAGSGRDGELEVLGLDGVPGLEMPEEGDDYAANAAAKARAAARAAGLPALADDSGLEVDALDGRPGPRSARYGGPGLDDAGRVRRLLAELAGVPGPRRGARFVCVAALALPAGEGGAGAEAGEVHTARGEWPGRILEAPRGEGGFGYDPIFWDEEHGAAAAELPARVKNRISHRARAVAGLREGIRAALGGA